MKAVITLALFTLMMSTGMSYRETMLPSHAKAGVSSWSQSYEQGGGKTATGNNFLTNIKNFFESRHLTGGIVDGRCQLLYIKEQ